MYAGHALGDNGRALAVSLRTDSDFLSSWGSTSSEARTCAASPSSSGSP